MADITRTIFIPIAKHLIAGQIATFYRCHLRRLALLQSFSLTMRCFASSAQPWTIEWSLINGGCDAPVRGSAYQSPHVDYQRPLFPEQPDLALPTYMLVVSFALLCVTPDSGPIEIAPGTHRLPRKEALRAVGASEMAMDPVPLETGDVLIRHPWALHRGSPNSTDTPRALLSIRYVRHWYADDSREVSYIPRSVWHSLTPDQQKLMRYPISPE